MKLAVLALVLLAGCSDRKSTEPNRDPERQRRVIEPPPRGVRALPPYAIRADGVGPYKLGATVATLLDQLPSGPRITQFSLPGVIQRDILRAEDDAILIGAEPQGKATFVSVVRPDIARTAGTNDKTPAPEAGVHVGSTRAELEKALGPPIEDPDRAQDPRIYIPTKLPNARVVLDGDKIIAFVVASEPERPREATSVESPCTRPAGDPDKHTFGACISANGEVGRYEADKLTLLMRDGEKVITWVPVPGLVFAAALRNPSDGRDDLVAITKTDETWSLTTFRLHDGKLLRMGEPALLYTLTAASARWIGADVHDLDLYLELTSRAESIEVGGLLSTRSGDKLRDIVVISPVSAPRKRAKPVLHEPADAGTTDAAAASEHPPGH